MEPIKICVQVEVNFSQSAQTFISQLAGAMAGAIGVVQQSATPAKPAAPEAPATPATPAKPVAPATSAKPAAPAAPVAPGITIEQVRKALADKVSSHREAIKEKLNSLGAPSVTKLDPSKYAEMYAFLTAL